ncbi:MAG: hypothetical protein K2W95_26630 [Candidatus Obscuribacterales bacterium]|nr:hypothetical protein [Candidatus Obscuribacterales bacterium]
MANQSGGGEKGGDPKKKQGAGNFNEMILGGLKSRAGKETVRWVKGLATEAEDLVMASAEKRDEGPAPQSPIAWVDKLFDLFQQYEVELNRVTVDQPELRLGTERPVFTESLLVRLQNNPNAEFTGRVHTREWTLAITGNIERVEGHIVPSAHLIAFSANESNFTRYFEVRPINTDQGLAWACEGGLVTWDRMHIFAKQIIGGLFHVSRGEGSENDPFIFNPEGLEAIKLSRKGEPEVTHPLFGGGGYLDKGPLLASDLDELDQAETIMPKSKKMEQSSPTPASAQRPAQVSDFKQTSDSAPHEVATTSVRCGTSYDDENALSTACDLLISAVDKELQNLSKAGAKAFGDHDFIAVEQTLRKSTRVKSLRDEIMQTVSQWKQRLAED